MVRRTESEPRWYKAFYGGLISDVTYLKFK